MSKKEHPFKVELTPQVTALANNLGKKLNLNKVSVVNKAIALLDHFNTASESGHEVAILKDKKVIQIVKLS